MANAASPGVSAFLFGMHHTHPDDDQDLTRGEPSDDDYCALAQQLSCEKGEIRGMGFGIHNVPAPHLATNALAELLRREGFEELMEECEMVENQEEWRQDAPAFDQPSELVAV